MQILIGDKGNVDFDSAIPMTAHQQNLFIEFMETIFNPVKGVETIDFRTDRIGDKFFGRRWDDEKEMAMLLDVNVKLEKVCELLGRTWMSVDIKRGEFVPELMMWADSKGYGLTDGDIEGLIKEYLDDKKEIAKEKRASKSSSEKYKNKLVDEIKKLNQMLDAINLRSKSGMVFPSDEEKIRETNEKISDIEDELLEKCDGCYIDGQMWYFEDDDDE